jgi:hypothetical protein
MHRVMWLATIIMIGALGQTPPQRMHFRDATVIKISSTAAYYEYTVETAEDGYICRSRRRLVVTEGSRVKVAIEGNYVYMTDENGTPQQTIGVSQYRLPAATPQKTTAMQRGSP